MTRCPGFVLAGLLLGLSACAEKFELPPVVEGEVPEQGAYNFDRAWEDVGRVQDMLLVGGALYVLTEREGALGVEAYVTTEREAVPVDAGLVGGFLGLEHPVALATGFQNTVRYLYVADNRGADLLDRQQLCDGGDCVLGLRMTEDGVSKQLASRTFDPQSRDFSFSCSFRLDGLSAGETFWTMLGTVPGRVALWLEVRPDGYLRPVRSDGAFPIDSLAFSFGEWHELEIDFVWTQREYDVRLDGEILDTGIPIFHPLDTGVGALAFRFDGADITADVDDLLITAVDGDGNDVTPLDLDFESTADVEEGWTVGPYFANDPPPTVHRYVIRTVGPPIQSFTDPSWVSVSGITIDNDDLTLFVAVEELDPADRTGVLTRSQVKRFDRLGEEFEPLAGSGTGLGFVTTPRDLYHDGTDVLVVEESLNRAQKLDGLAPNTGIFQIPPQGGDAWFAGPTDVATDMEGYILVADTQNNRVMRFTPEGTFADTVYSLTFPPTLEAGAILAPPAVEAQGDEAWVSDPSGERVVVLKRADEISGGGS